MTRQEIHIPELLPRQEVFDPTNPDKPLRVPDCSHTHGSGAFQYPVVLDERDLPNIDDKHRQY